MNFLSKTNEKLKKINSSFELKEKEGCLFLAGNTESYDELLKAGKISTSKKYIGLINDIKLNNYNEKNNFPSNVDYSLDNIEVDCLIIGGGVIGCSILRELSKYNLKSLLIEKESDLCMHQSGKNCGVIHTGVDIINHPLRANYCARGNAMFDKLASDLEVPFEHSGQIILLKNAYEKIFYGLLKTHQKSLKAPKIKLLSRKKILQIEPRIPQWCKKGIFLPSSGVINPFKYTIALAENAVENGALISLETAALKMDVEDGIIKSVYTNKGKIIPKVVINAAGIHSDEIADLAKDRTFTIHPIKGTILVMNEKESIVNTAFSKSVVNISENLSNLSSTDFIKKASSLFYDKKQNKIISSIRSIEGETLIGPNKNETLNKEDYSTSKEDVDYILNQAMINSPNIDTNNILTYYSGTIAATYEEDFVVRKGIYTKNIMEAAGIQIPGLTASPAIAEDIVKWTVEYLNKSGMVVKSNKTFNPHHKSIKSLKEYPPSLRDKIIKANPAYGTIICKCEEISLGEIQDCLSSVLPVYTIDAIKRRVRAGMGKCQGSYCKSRILEILSKKKRIEIEKINKSNSESNILLSLEKDSKNV